MYKYIAQTLCSLCYKNANIKLLKNKKNVKTLIKVNYHIRNIFIYPIYTKQTKKKNNKETPMLKLVIILIRIIYACVKIGST